MIRTVVTACALAPYCALAGSGLAALLRAVRLARARAVLAFTVGGGDGAKVCGGRRVKGVDLVARRVGVGVVGGGGEELVHR
eukprot:23681-Rhodomonas_salina.1